MKDREQQRTFLKEQLAALEASTQVAPLDMSKVYAQLRGYLTEWRKPS